MRNVYFIYPKV